MNRQLVVIVMCLVLLAAVALMGQSFEVKEHSSSAGRPLYVPDELIVKFKSGVSETEVSSLNAEMGTEIKSSSNKPGKFKVLKIKKNKSVEELIAKYSDHKHIGYIEPNTYCYATAVPNDPYYSYQWHFDNTVTDGIHMEAAWNITSGDPGVIIGILDSGVAYETYRHGRDRFYQAPDLAGTTFVSGYDFINNDSHANDDDGHGTHVCGTIAQTTNNGVGVAGIAYNCAIMPVKVLDETGSGTAASLANGLYFAADNGADVVNMSLSWPPGYNPGSTVENAIAYAYSHGVTLVASSGNDNVNQVCYPAAYDTYVIAVGATRYDEQIAYYSNTGSSLDIVAPGGDVTVDQNNDGYPDGVLQQTFDNNPASFDYYFFQGTSMAAPHVAGVAGLVIANGTTGPDNVREALQNSADDLGASGWDSEYGHGLLNAYAALNYGGTQPNTPPVADAGGPYYGTVGVPITFDGTDSSDPDGDPIVSYEWNFGDGSTGSGATPTHTYSEAGSFLVSLVVNDGEDDSDPAFSSSTISPGGNQAPVADAGGPYSADLGQAITFDGGDSYDPDGDPIVSYQWDFGDGSTGSGENPNHTYGSAGTFNVTLVVSDGELDSDPDYAQATITDPGANPKMVVSDIQLSVSSRVRGKFLTGNATVTVIDEYNNPVSGAVVTAHWSGVINEAEEFVTDANGIGTCSTSWVKEPDGFFVFTIDNVVGSGYIFDQANSTLTASIPAAAKDVSFIAFPNPGNPNTHISYYVESPADVKVAVFNVLGRQVRLLADEFHSAGAYEVNWDGRDDNGMALTSGVYLIRLNINGDVQHMRILLAK